MNLNLEGRTALVTGATTGIGRGIAEALAREGVRVAITGRREDLLGSLAAAIAATGAPAPVILAADLVSATGPQQIADAALAACGGRIDILVNNAGASRPFTDAADDAVWGESMALNFDAARRLTTLLVPPMREAGWGRIINLTGALVAPGLNASGAAKAALHSWSRTMAITLAPHAITVNAIAPGRINSEQIAQRLHPTEQSRDDFIAKFIPAGHFGEPEDIAALVAFLASPLARYISGAAIPVDGAMLRIA